MASKDFTDDFLKIRRSGFNTEEELDSALASAKEKYKEELALKSKKDKEEKEKVKKLDSIKTSLYFDYLRYLQLAYPDFKVNEEVKKQFFKELEYIDFSVGARKVGSYTKDDFDSAFDEAINKILKDVFI